MRSAIVCALSAIALHGQFFSGKLDAALSKDARPRWGVHTLNPAVPDVSGIRLGAPLTRAWEAEISWRGSGGKVKTALFLTSNSRYWFAADLDHNGRFSSEETREMRRAAEEGAFDLSWDLRIPGSPFRVFPVKFRILGSNTYGKTQVLHVNDWNFITGSARIGGKPLRVALDYDPAKEFDPSNGRMGLDTNGDGHVEMLWYSPEWAMAERERVVFRAGQRYFSFESFDVRRLTFRLKEHGPEEYARIELRPGVELPDFAFVDFEGKNHRLSEFSGHYVLLEFWGSWCGPCIARFPALKATWTKWKDRGLVVLGMDNDEKPEAALETARKHELPWINARTAEIRELYEKRLRISAWPTLILVGADRRIVSAGFEGQKPLEGAGLDRTLDELLR